MNEVVTLFGNFLFPTALCILLLYFLYKYVWLRIEKTLDRVTETNKALSKTNEELSKSNRLLAENMSKKLNDMDCKIDKLIKKEGVVE